MKPPNALRSIRLALWGLAGLAFVGFGVLWLGQFLALAPGVMLNAPFQLVDQHGRTVTERDLRGKAAAWFFGFTHCPDVCPTTLAEMTEHLEALGPDGDKLNVVFVTVDPERDTPEVLKEYLSAFDPRIIALSGTPADIEATVKGRFAYSAKVPLEIDDYTMQHTSSVLLMGADGTFKGTLDFHEPRESGLAKLRQLVRDA